jgi:hypothetical protein
VTVGWSDPRVTGGAAISGYRVTASNGAGHVTIDKTIEKGPLAITGLDGKDLRIQIRAINAVGEGPAATSVVRPAPMPRYPALTMPPLTMPPLTMPPLTVRPEPVPVATTSPTAAISVPAPVAAVDCAAPARELALDPRAELSPTPLLAAEAPRGSGHGLAVWLLLGAAMTVSGEAIRITSCRRAGR